MRIVGGRWRGRPLAGPISEAIRPTSDRLREAIFNVLAHGLGDPVPDARVLDMFAGTGAMGLEALSRGAVFVILVDDGTEARGLMRQNVEALGAGGMSRVFRRDATRLGAAAPNPPADLVFCDPPYGRALAGPALLSAMGGGWLKAGATVVVEEAVASAFAWPDGLEEVDRRRYGETEVAFGRVSAQRQFDEDVRTAAAPAAASARGPKR